MPEECEYSNFEDYLGNPYLQLIEKNPNNKNKGGRPFADNKGNLPYVTGKDLKELCEHKKN